MRRNRQHFIGCVLFSIIILALYISVHKKYQLVTFLRKPSPALYTFQTPTRGDSNIIFLETSCAVNTTAHTSLKLKLNSQQACAIESAAKSNPDSSIYLFHTCKLNDASLSISSRMLQRVFQYPNVHIWHESMESFFGGTPLEELYKSGKMKKSDYPTSHASDVLRFLVLWKYGGIYLDLDFIVLRPLSTLNPNFAGVECCDYLASGALGLTVEGLGKKMADACVEELRTNFRGDIFSHNGPALITRVLRAQCGINNTELMTQEVCGGFNVLPSTAFYPILYAWRLFYNETLSDVTMAKIREGHAVHLWNTLMGWEGGNSSLLRPGSKQPIVLLQQEFCPVVYDETAIGFEETSLRIT